MKTGKFSVVFIVFLWLPTSAQVTSSMDEKRKGAEIGAKPCKYETVTHPSVLIVPERLLSVKEDIRKKKSERRQVYEQYIKEEADFWLHQTIDIPATGGWVHDFFCSDGSILEIPADKRFCAETPSKCPVCGKTYLDDKILAARRAFVHYWYSGAARNLALVYAVEGDERYAAKAMEILDAYADVYPTQTIMRQTLEEAVVLIPLVESYDLIYNYMPEAKRHQIRDRLFWPAAQALTKAGLGGNWGSWHLSAIGVIGYATRHQRFIDYATNAFKDQISKQLGDDGLWPESVHTYHFYPLNGFLSFMEAAKNHGDDLYLWEAKEGKGIKKMLTAPLHYVYPDMRLAAINDGWFDSYLPQDIYTVGYHYYRLPEFAWAVQQSKKNGKSGMLGDMLDVHYRNMLYGEELPKKINKPKFASIDFPVLGIAVLRQGSQLTECQETMLTFDYGPYLGHGHPDKMGVTLFAKGKLLAADYGTSGYASASSRFLKSTPSHNTLVIDGENHPPAKDRNLTAFIDSEYLKLASSTTDQIAPDVKWNRTVILLNDYIVIHDRIDGATKHRYDWFFHAEGEKLEVDAPPPIAVGPEEFDYPFLTKTAKWNVGDDVGFMQWEYGDYGLGLWFMRNNPELNTYTSSMPTGEGDKTVPLVVLRQEESKADFFAVLKPMKGKKEKTMENEEVSFTQDAAGHWIIQVSTDKQKDRIHLGNDEITYIKNGKSVLNQRFNTEK
jgi:hypothetical protein